MQINLQSDKIFRGFVLPDASRWGQSRSTRSCMEQNTLKTPSIIKI